ncbi:SPFH domain-containing protein [candidate division WOR-3 bacterium]|nr:SPFH domain-containing protein [candidate division WOR-3 bacterium]
MAKFFEVIEFFDETGEEIVHRIPETGSGETQLGSQLVVRENQYGVFFRDGKALDVFGPGRHSLTTLNLPGIRRVIGAAFDGKSPFRVEVYFVNGKVFTNSKWGTQEPIPFRDTELHMVRLRAFGTYSERVIEPQLFINKVVGTQGIYRRDEIEDFLRSIIIARLTDFLGENLKSIFDLPQHYDEVAAGTKARVQDDFSKYGLELIDFYINAITPPQDVQKMIDERSGMGAVGDLGRFTQFSTARALRDAARQTGDGGAGTAGAGLGLGAGLGMGMMMPGMISQAYQQQGAQIRCPKCGAMNPAHAKFCSGCGTKLEMPTISCPKCKQPVPLGSRFCPNCGTSLAPKTIKCQKCGKDIPEGTKFCPECGNNLSAAEKPKKES